MRAYPVIHALLYQRGEFRTIRDKVAGLRALGIEVVVCCQRQDDPELRAVVDYWHVPLSDGQHCDYDAAWRTAMSVADAVRDARPVLVHCAAGVNRSGLVNALAVREITGCSGAEAMARVRRARPGALTNEWFVQHLRALPPLELGVA
jgi:protein-tyrosine phosphatase